MTDDLQQKRRHYAIGVINELKSFGYSETDAKKVFLRHYRGLRRIYGLNMNVFDFAKVIDEIEHSANRAYDPNDPNLIYVGHLRDRLKTRKKAGSSGKTFRITEKMEWKIKEWDTCIPVDVTGAQFAYIFIPTGRGLVIKVQCDVCKRELDLTDW